MGTVFIGFNKYMWLDDDGSLTQEFEDRSYPVYGWKYTGSTGTFGWESCFDYRGHLRGDVNELERLIALSEQIEYE
jgi:hypothetical protein